MPLSKIHYENASSNKRDRAADVLLLNLQEQLNVRKRERSILTWGFYTNQVAK